MPATAVEHEHRVTPRELFFDLVFVFAFTQVATLLADDPTFAGIGRGVLVLAALWWAWTAYAWLTNTVDPEEGVVGAALLVALIAMFVAALVVPGVFDDEGVLFGAAFLVVCAMHLTLYALAGRGNRDLLGAVLRLAPWTLLGATLILVAGFTDGARTWLWLAALVVHLRRRRAERVDGLAAAPVALRGAPRPRADHRARRGVHLDRDRGDGDRDRPGRGRRRDPRAPRRHVVLARLLRLLRDPRRADARRPPGRRTRRARPRRVRVRALPDDRRHRALRVRDEDHRRARRRGARLRRRLRALRRERALPAHVLGDPDPDRTAAGG